MSDTRYSPYIHNFTVLVLSLMFAGNIWVNEYVPIYFIIKEAALRKITTRNIQNSSSVYKSFIL